MEKHKDVEAQQPGDRGLWLRPAITAAKPTRSIKAGPKGERPSSRSNPGWRQAGPALRSLGTNKMEPYQQSP